MTEKQAYSYTVLRYVHDVVSGEALNVGIVMHVPSTRLLKGQTRKTIGRLRHVFPDLDRRAFVEAMRAVDRGLAAIAKRLNGAPLFDGLGDARSHALDLLPADDSSLQWSPVGTGLTADVGRTFERLYERYVARYDRPTERSRTDEDIWRPVAEKLAENEALVPFETKVVHGLQDDIEFSKAWKNGRWHAYEPISFDLADADNIKDKARRWRGHLSAVTGGGSDKFDLTVHFVLGRPQDTSLLHAYTVAKKILEGADLTDEVVDEDGIDDLVATLVEEFRTHQSSGVG